MFSHHQCAPRPQDNSNMKNPPPILRNTRRCQLHHAFENANEETNPGTNAPTFPPWNSSIDLCRPNLSPTSPPQSSTIRAPLLESPRWRTRFSKAYRWTTVVVCCSMLCFAQTSKTCTNNRVRCLDHPAFTPIKGARPMVATIWGARLPSMHRAIVSIILDD